ncbi:MAG: hemolysin III family protein [Thermoguttaceae bacterium]|nr:hemolysin III family protein [Thermoguttaceae bacterium]
MEVQEKTTLVPGRTYGLGEEITNSITHGIGTGLSIAALVLLIVRAATCAPAGKVAPYVVGSCVFGVSLILLYTMSTLYHAFAVGKTKRVFSVLDHSAIFVLIAGTYTGFCLTVLYGPLGWWLFGIIWGLAALGITLHACFRERAGRFTFPLYLIMGWLIVVVARQLFHVLPPAALLFLFLGGVTYSLGCIFFVMKRVRWMHSIWHLFVLAGSILHFLALYAALRPYEP